MKKPSFIIAPFLAFTAAIMVDGQTATNTLNSVAHDASFTAFVEVYRHLAREELWDYQSDQKYELEKFGYAAPLPLDTATVKSDAIKAFLATLPSLAAISNAPVEALITVDKQADKITKEQISPAWIDNAWVDATRLASNGFDCSNQLQVLSILNCCAIRKRITDTAWGDALSHDFNERMKCRMKLFYAGYETKFDKTFGIWRITGTNAPAIHSP
jgi:hypothetical protein